MKLIKRRDKFGHPAQFKFNNQGSHHNTFCGGCISIGIILFMLFYVLEIAKKWIRMEDDSN